MNFPDYEKQLVSMDRDEAQSALDYLCGRLHGRVASEGSFVPSEMILQDIQAALDFGRLQRMADRDKL
jgi:hypothetical protein